MIKPLVIGHSYLLEKYSTGQVLRSFFERLGQFGFSPTVLCSKSYYNNVDIKSLNCKVIPTYDCQPIRYLIALAKRVISTDFAFLPDYTYFSWAKISAIRKIRKLIKSGEFDYIHSISIPCSSHLIALEAKKKYDIPWIASFFDPWYKNPYRTFNYKWAQERDRRFEEKIAQNADVIVHTNHVIYEEWLERYGDFVKDKMIVLPLVFNVPNVKVSIRQKKTNKFVISHIGSLYEGRDASDFIKAIHLLIQKHPEIADRIEINFVGTVPSSDKSLVNKLGLDKMFNFRGFLKENECIHYFINSDLYVAIDGKEARDIFFPSKIMKYFYFGKPILGLSPQNSVLSKELQQSNNFCFLNDDLVGIAKFLYDAIVSYDKICINNQDYWKKYSIEEVGEKYLNVVEHLLVNCKGILKKATS